MIIIGEKINGAIPSVGEAVRRRDAGFIKNLVHIQVEAGVDYLDVCAGTAPEEEWEALNWLLDTVQEETDTPLCMDSPNPQILKDILPRVKREGMLNSVSGEGNKCEMLYPLIAGTGWKVVALTCDDKGIPSDAPTKIKIAGELIEKAQGYGITPDRMYIDPLVLSLSAVNDSMINFMEAVRGIKALHPTVNITSGLSNISYGMPCRKLVNQNFLALALSVGMDSAIVDPANRDMRGTILATEALLGRDRCCRRYNNAYRKGLIGPVKSK